MQGKLVLNFSKTFEGKVWNVTEMAQKGLLILEIRDESKREASFSAFQFKKRSFLWENLMVEEPWWVSVAGSSGSELIFQVYDDMQNPEHKTFLALNSETKEVVWKKKEVSFEKLEIESDAGKISRASHPFQYLEGNAYFETIKKFLQKTCGKTIVMGAEYLEADGIVCISYYVMEPSGLANYLLVVSENGDVLLKEELGRHLKGLGVETFFILQGYLFFVRNKREFISYQIQ